MRRARIAAAVLLITSLAGACASPPPAKAPPPAKTGFTVADWYEVHPLRDDLFLVREPADASFFVLRSGDQALLVDSGLGLDLSAGRALLSALGIKTFSVLVTHAHCDHIGLNSLAEHVYVSKAEWKKFLRHHDDHQIATYYRLLKDEVPWPKTLHGVPTQAPWKPTDFLQDHQVVSLGNWKLEAISTPGHTLGHMAYLDRGDKLLFLGDLLYDGTLYLHMPDSSLSSFDQSLAKVETLIRENPGLTLLPAHNSIPLDASYVGKIRVVLEEIRHGSLAPTGEQKGNEALLDAELFEQGGVKMAIRKDELTEP